MAPTREINYTMLETKSSDPRSVCVKAGIPRILYNVFAFLLMCPHCLKVKAILLEGGGGGAKQSPYLK